MEHKSDVRLEIKNVSKKFEGSRGEVNEVVKNVSLQVYNNEFLVILGPGRCGKSVLLNMIAGLLPVGDGEILLDGENITGPSPKIGMVFQKLGLMPWLTVIENVEFGLKMRGIDKKTRREKAQHYIEMVGLEGFEKHYPYQLSGGMKQRVGIARAYTDDVEILIMDEPFGQLDAQTRYNMQQEIVNIAEKDKRTIIFVTNNIEEAVKVGDRIILFTKCPAQVKEVYQVNMKKPRDEISEEFLKMRKLVSENTDLAL